MGSAALCSVLNVCKILVLPNLSHRRVLHYLRYNLTGSLKTTEPPSAEQKKYRVQNHRDVCFGVYSNYKIAASTSPTLEQYRVPGSGKNGRNKSPALTDKESFFSLFWANKRTRSRYKPSSACSLKTLCQF